jgi:hypothetical protein
MTTTPVLAFPDFSNEFIIETNACETGIDALLSQFGHPLANFNKGLSTTNQNLSTYEKKSWQSSWQLINGEAICTKIYSLSRLTTKACVKFKIRPCSLICKEKQ